MWPQSDPGHQYRLSDQERTSGQDVTEEYAGPREKVPLIVYIALVSIFIQ